MYHLLEIKLPYCSRFVVAKELGGWLHLVSAHNGTIRWMPSIKEATDYAIKVSRFETLSHINQNDANIIYSSESPITYEDILQNSPEILL